MDPNRGFNSLYVYCDAAESIPVGDIKAPLLRVVDAAGNFGDLIHRRLSTFSWLTHQNGNELNLRGENLSMRFHLREI